jgi:hypothetical protein
VIRRAIGKFADWALNRLYAGSVIATIDGVPIVSLRGDQGDFLRVISISFDLLRIHDPKRLGRIASSARWIVDCSLAMGARSGQFHRRHAAIEMDFEFSDEFGDDLHHAAYYAGLMVHEATHGMLLARGFDYTEETRIQTERICIAEENRFLARLGGVRADLADSLRTEFNADDWMESWNMSSADEVKRLLKRVFEK